MSSSSSWQASACFSAIRHVSADASTHFSAHIYSQHELPLELLPDRFMQQVSRAPKQVSPQHKWSMLPFPDRNTSSLCRGTRLLPHQFLQQVPPAPKNRTGVDVRSAQSQGHLGSRLCHPSRADSRSCHEAEPCCHSTGLFRERKLPAAVRAGCGCEQREYRQQHSR